MNQPPDLILHRARIYTVDADRPWAEAVAIHGERFSAVGANQEILALAGAGTNVMDLGGRLVLPGLCDAHIHFYDWCLSRRSVQLAGCRSRDEMLDRIHDWVSRSPDTDWLIGRGWNETRWSPKTMPTRTDLDLVTGSDRPAIFWRSDMHAAVANSAALRAAGIKAETPDPPGGVIGREERGSENGGRPNGLLWELAINLVVQVMPDPSPAFVDEALIEGTAELHRLGVTAVHDQRMKDQVEGPLALAAYQRLRAAGRLKLRVNCNIAAHYLRHLTELGLRGGFGDDYLRLGHIKLFADGTMGSQTAWMLAPFEKGAPGDAENLGLSVTPTDQMAAEMARAVAAGLPVSVHAIGDRANRAVLDIFEELLGSAPPTTIPHRVEHVQIIDPVDLPRLGALGLTASVQPIHALDDMETAERVLGARAEHVYNFRSLAEGGALLALGSDAPVADPNPFLGFHAALCRQRPEQMADGPWFGAERLTLEQTIEGYTLGAARAAGWDDAIGRIAVGKRADLIVVDRNIFDVVETGVQGSELADTQVVLTVYDGKTVYSAL